MNYNKENLLSIVSESRSMSEVCRKLGITISGKGFNLLKGKFKQYEISTDHFLGRGWSKGLTYKNSTPHKTIATKNSKHDLSSLKEGVFLSSNTLRRLYQQTGIDKKCVECSTGELWNGKSLTLQIDHINGNRYDNRVENLRYLCPNCHTQTETYGSKNDNRKSIICEEVLTVEKNSIECKICHSQTFNTKYCSNKCSSIATRKCSMSTEDIHKLWVEKDKNYKIISNQLGISQNAIRKRFRIANLEWKLR